MVRPVGEEAFPDGPRIPDSTPLIAFEFAYLTEEAWVVGQRSCSARECRPLRPLSQPMIRRVFCLIRLMRPHQWIKNALVLAPLLLSGSVCNAMLVQQAAIATLVFCLTASLVYIFNDIHDIAADSAHVKKRLRPLPSGEVSVPEAWILFVLLLSVAAMMFWILHPARDLLGVIAIYLTINLGYSLGLKQIPIIELFLVMAGYVLRLIAGGIAIEVQPIKWIVVCTGLIALMLATGKRRADIAQRNDVNEKRRSLSGYTVAFLDNFLSALAATTIVSYLFFCMSRYAIGQFGEAVFLSGAPVAIGILRYMQIILEGGGDSPTAIVYQDPVLRYTIVVFVVLFFAFRY
jgi:decaprenyl-phosphate phosphoribosyltransferase